MTALPLTAFCQEGPKFKLLLECLEFFEHFLGSRPSAWLLAVFFLSLPLTGLYLVIEPVIQLASLGGARMKRRSPDST